MLNKLSEATGNRLSVEELKQYQVFTEVPLVVNAEGGFMKADIVLLKASSDGEIIDVIVIENKLSKTTEFTARQKEGFYAIAKSKDGCEMTVHYTVKCEGVELSKGQTIKIGKDKIYRIHDHGESNGPIEIEKITDRIVNVKTH